MKLTLSAHDVRRVAVEARADPRTVLRRIRGEDVRSTTAARVDEALRALGFVQAAGPATSATGGAS